MAEYVTKDSGQRVDFASGMRRDVADDKPNFSLCLAEGVPFEDQLLTRWAALMQRGAVKYGDRNWELASSKEELERFRSSALRHMMQWATGANPEEDHAAAVLFNLAAYETTKLKVEQKPNVPFDTSLRVGAKVIIRWLASDYNGKSGTVLSIDSGGWVHTAVPAYSDIDTLCYKPEELEVIG